MRRYAYTALIFVGSLLVLGCGMPMMFGMPGVIDQDSAGLFLPSEASNGERIFKTGINIDGERIAFEGGAPWLAMHGGGCASCHGADGTGGTTVFPSTVTAPDIRYSSLTSEDHEEDAGGHPPYDEELLVRAIRDGSNPAGEPLDWPMPRWKLSDRDMADLISFIKSLDEEKGESE